MMRTIKNNIAVAALALIFSVPAVSFAGGPIQPSGSKQPVGPTRSVSPSSRINLQQDLKSIINKLTVMRLNSSSIFKVYDFTLAAVKPGKVAFKFTGDACGASGLKCPDFKGAGTVNVTILSDGLLGVAQTKIVKINKDFVTGNKSMDEEIRPGDKIQFKLDGSMLRLNSANELLAQPIKPVDVRVPLPADGETYRLKFGEGLRLFIEKNPSIIKPATVKDVIVPSNADVYEQSEVSITILLRDGTRKEAKMKIEHLMDALVLPGFKSYKIVNLIIS